MKVKRIGSDELDRELPIHQDSLHNQLNDAFMGSYYKDNQSLIKSLNARKQMDEMIVDSFAEEHKSEVVECAVDNVHVSFKIGDNSDQPNANGDIIDWSNCSNLTAETITVDESSTNDSIFIGDSTCDPSSMGIVSPNNTGVLYPHSMSDHSIQPSLIYTGTTATGRSVNQKYAVIELDRDNVPVAVYICGRMVTLGILGTDVECAFAGNKLVFEPGVIGTASFEKRITISIEYDDEICHFNIGDNGRITYTNEHSSTLVATLVSTIKKKKGTTLVGVQ